MMTKYEFVTQLAQRAVLTKKQASEALDIVFELMKEAVERDGKIRFDAIGTFERYVRQGRRGRNPATGEVIEIPARTVVGASRPRLPGSASSKRLTTEGPAPELIHAALLRPSNAGCQTAPQSGGSVFVEGGAARDFDARRAVRLHA